MKLRIVLLVLALGGFLFFLSRKPSPPEPTTAAVRIGDNVIAAEVLTTPKQQSTGFKGAPVVPGNGLVFAFGAERPATSWTMRGVKQPLSLALVNAGKVVSVVQLDVCPPAKACLNIKTAVPHDTAIEAPAGTFTAATVGQAVQIVESHPRPTKK